MTPEHIIARVAHHYGLSIADITGHSRKLHIAYARQVAMWCIKTALPRVSFETIGGLFQRDHTTVMYAVEKIDRAITADVALAEELYGLIAQTPPRRVRRRSADDPIWWDCKLVRSA